MDLLMHPVQPVRPLAGYVGGKKHLARRLADRMRAIPHDLYGEAFVGMGGVFLRRTYAPKVEVINDLSGDVATLFRVLQNHYQALMDMLRWQLTSREEWTRLNGLDPERLTDLQRAARFLYLQRQSFGGKVAGRSFGIDTGSSGAFDVHALGPLLQAVHERLSGVWIERLGWSEFLDRWDREGALFYFDPPYLGTERFYGKDAFDVGQFARLARRLRDLKGRWMVSLNDHAEVRRIFQGFPVEEVKVRYSTGLQPGTIAGELIITDGR